MWRDDRPVDVQVSAGEVTLAGEVRVRDEVDVLLRMVRLVPGVVSARSELTWAQQV